jgi:hypothetical protein
MALQSSPLGTITIRTLSSWAILHGLLTIIGGPSRWVSPAYDYVSLLPGSPYSWGAFLVVGGLLALYASLKGVDYVISLSLFGREVNVTYDVIKNTGLRMIALWCMIFMIGFIAAIFVHPEISLAAADRDIPFIIFALMMTKAREPRYIK